MIFRPFKNGLPGVLGNKGTWPFGTMEQKENKTGNTGTKAYFREQGTNANDKLKIYHIETLVLCFSPSASNFVHVSVPSNYLPDFRDTI